MIYVDSLQSYPKEAVSRSARRHGVTWCHLFADTVEELHHFAAKIGMKRRWFQDQHEHFPHYDLLPSRRAKAIKLGAQEIDLKDFLRRKYQEKY